MFFSENLEVLLSANIAFDRSHYGLSPNPYYKQKKSKHARCLLFLVSVSEVFAVAKVKLCYTQ